MRVISGTARGTKLYSLEGMNTRPTLDRVKESLFNILGNKVKEASVLDLFSGSGAIGIEFASRGARQVVFCDKAKEAMETIQKNIEKTRLQTKAILIKDNFQKCLQQIQYKFDYIYIDPPYDTNLAIEAIKEIWQTDALNPDGIVIIETDEQEKVVKQLEELQMKMDIYDIRKYGRVKLLFVRKG